MRKGLIFGFLTAFVLLFGIQPGISEARQFISIGGGPTGGTFNYFANGFAIYIPRVESDIRASAEGSGGSVENVRRVSSGDFDFGLSYAVDMGLANIGQLPQDERKYENIRSIGYLFGAPGQLIVRANSDFKSAKDLKGRRVAVGNAGSGAATAAERFFRHIGVWDEMRPQFLGYSAAASAFQDRQIDAFWVLVGYPNASVIEAATQVNIRLIDIGKDAEESDFYDAYAYAGMSIPQGTYPNMEADAHVFQDSTIFITRDDVDEDVVYRMTKAIWSKEGLAYMRQAHSAAREMTMEQNFKNASMPLHKGAARFWEEQGIEIPEHLKPID